MTGPTAADLDPLWLSVRVASLAALLDVAAGVPLALLLARGRFPGKGLLAGLLVLPLVLPPTVLGYYILLILGRRGWVGAWLESQFGVMVVFHWSGAVIAAAVAAFPLFLLPARGAIEGVDPALEDVARMLGRREWSVFAGVTLPLAWRGMAAGAILVFVKAMGDFGATMMVAGNIPGRTQTVAAAIYNAVEANEPGRAAWLSVCVSVVSIAALWVVQRSLPAGGRPLITSFGGSYALDADLAHQVHPGLRLEVALTLGRECGVIFGRSGAGKTTILRLIAGLARPDRGFVRIGGETAFDSAGGIDRPLRERRVAMVFQDDLLFPHLSVAGNVRFGLKGQPRAEADRRVEEVAALCGVDGLLGRKPATLSGGERQRVGLARALAPRPRLLLCDEPVSALDLTGRRALVERLRAVQAAEAIPVLYVTHSPAEAVTLGSRLFLIDRGRVVDQGAPLDVLARSGTGPESALGGILNEFPAVIEDNPVDAGETRLRLEGGPILVVPRRDEPVGAAVVVAVRAEEILLARGPVEGLSARNAIAGKVDRVVAHGREAEVLVRTGSLTWAVSVVGPAVEALGLVPGVGVSLVIKARSVQVRPEGGGGDGKETV